MKCKNLDLISFKWRSSIAHFSLMSSLFVVILKPLIQVSLEFFAGFINVFPECRLVKLIQDCLMEPLADPIIDNNINIDV